MQLRFRGQASTVSASRYCWLESVHRLLSCRYVGRFEVTLAWLESTSLRENAFEQYLANA